MQVPWHKNAIGKQILCWHCRQYHFTAFYLAHEMAQTVEVCEKWAVSYFTFGALVRAKTSH